MLTRLKQPAKALAAIFLLFFTQFLYFYLEADFGVEDLRFAIAELVFFFVFFALILLDLHLPAAGWTVLGCAALGALRCYLITPSAANATVFLAHLPPCIFLLTTDRAAKKPKQDYGILLTGVYPTLFLGYLIYGAFRFSQGAESIVGAGLHFGCFAFPALLVLFGALRRSPLPKKDKTNRAPAFVKDAYLFAMLAIAETFFMLRICGTASMDFTVSLFWFTDLLILYKKGDPLLVAFFRRFGIQEKSS